MKWGGYSAVACAIDSQRGMKSLRWLCSAVLCCSQGGARKGGCERAIPTAQCVQCNVEQSCVVYLRSCPLYQSLLLPAYHSTVPRPPPVTLPISSLVVPPVHQVSCE
jgi:hypothetical protein